MDPWYQTPSRLRQIGWLRDRWLAKIYLEPTLAMFGMAAALDYFTGELWICPGLAALDWSAVVADAELAFWSRNYEDLSCFIFSAGDKIRQFTTLNALVMPYNWEPKIPAQRGLEVVGQHRKDYEAEEEDGIFFGESQGSDHLLTGEA